MNSVEILDEKNTLKLRAEEIINNCKKEVRTLTEDEEKEVNGIKERIAELNDEMDKLQKELETYDDKLPKDNEEKVETKSKIDNNKKHNSTLKMNKEFRLLKAIRDIANNQTLDEVTSAVIEKGKEEMRKSGLNYGGQIQLPTEERATITVTTEHDDVIETEFLNLLEPLRAKNVLANAGARYLTNLVGDVQQNVYVNDNSIQGTLKYVTNWTQYSEDTEENTGYFLVLKYDASEGATVTVQTLGGYHDETVTTLDPSDMQSVIKFKDNKQKIKVVTTLGGETITKILSLSGLRTIQA